jgi:hypothetical protein
MVCEDVLHQLDISRHGAADISHIKLPSVCETLLRFLGTSCTLGQPRYGFRTGILRRWNALFFAIDVRSSAIS